MAGLLTLSPNANVFPKKLSDFVTCTVKKTTHSCRTVGDSHPIPY